MCKIILSVMPLGAIVGQPW